MISVRSLFPIDQLHILSIRVPTWHSVVCIQSRPILLDTKFYSQSPSSYITVKKFRGIFPKAPKHSLYSVPQIHVPSSLLITKLQYKPPIDLHLLVLVVFKLQPADILLHPGNLRAVERCSLRVASQNVFADGVVWENCVGRRNSNQCRSRRFIDLPWRAGFVRFRILDFVPSATALVIHNKNSGDICRPTVSYFLRQLC